MSTAVILAGGMSRRMGRDKPLLQFHGKSLLRSAVDRFSAVYDRVLVSVADGGKYPDLADRIVVDAYPGCGPMAGLHAALSATEDEGVFLVAADMPFSNPQAALALMRLCGQGEICALPAASKARYEHLFAYYKKSLLPLLEELLEAGDYRLGALFDRARVTVVQPAALGPLWREELLANINTPQEYERLLQFDRTREEHPHEDHI